MSVMETPSPVPSAYWLTVAREIAQALVRRAPQEGQKPRRLQLKATSFS